MSKMNILKSKRESGIVWFGFWMFFSVFFACDTLVFLQGHDSLFRSHEISQEIELQKLKIEEKKLSIELLKQST